jgi:P27 family predicted phage terminase small subunit
MGKRGPIPKSNEQEMLEGNPSKRPLRGETPKPEHGIPICPSWLSPMAKQEWRRVVPELAKLGLLTKLDRNILAGYCNAYALWRQTQELLTVQGTVYVNAKGQLQPRPEVIVAKNAGEEMQTFAAELGLTPSSRARMNLPKANEEIDPIEEILREVENERRNR